MWRVLICVLMICTALRAQDASQLADQLQRATDREHPAILREQSPEALRAVYQILASKNAKYFSDAQYEPAVAIGRITLEIAETLNDPKLKIASYRSMAPALRTLSKNAEALEFSRMGVAAAEEIGDKNSQAYFHG